MSTLPTFSTMPESSPLESVPARSSDHLSDLERTRILEKIDRWDSYEVWRRFIKDARDRRERGFS